MKFKIKLKMPKIYVKNVPVCNICSEPFSYKYSPQVDHVIPFGYLRQEFIRNIMLCGYPIPFLFEKRRLFCRKTDFF